MFEAGAQKRVGGRNVTGLAVELAVAIEERRQGLKVGEDGLRWVVGFAEGGAAAAAALSATLPLDAVRTAQAGLAADYEALHAAVYDGKL